MVLYDNNDYKMMFSKIYFKHFYYSFLYIFRMSSNRQPRRAKQAAINIINANNQGSDISDEESEMLEEDDVANQYDEVEQEDFVEDAIVDLDNDEVIDDDMAFDMEEDVISSDEEPENVVDTYLSRTGFDWSPNAVRVGRTPQHNVFNINGNQGFNRGLRPLSRVESFMIIFDDIVEIVVQSTNMYGRRFVKGWKVTSTDEILAFLGLHMLAGVFKAHHRHSKELWSQRDGHSLFVATMSYNRFCQIRLALRFDDTLRRNHNDKLAPIRCIVESFNSKISNIYQPGPYLTIDEMLIEFHGRVAFRQYIPTKPGKFGIKVYWLVDNDNTMPLRCLVYIGEGTLLDSQINGSISESIVLALSNNYLGCGRNITGDNYFTSESLSIKLLNKKTSYVGTLRKNRREIPGIVHNLDGRQRGDSWHFYCENSTICSFWDKGNKAVLLWSTMHGAQIDKVREQGKPDIVEFYNSTKSGVDNLDKLVRGYNSKRKTRRWPCAVFFTLMDTGVLAAQRLMKHHCDHLEDHYTFKKELAYDLCSALILQRQLLPALRNSVKEAMARSGFPVTVALPDEINFDERCQGRCTFCGKGTNKKSRTRCRSCGKFVCSVHQHMRCSDCL
jgi:hypothetical protein